MVHVTTRMIPFEALFGRPTSTVLSYEKGSGLVNEIDRLLINRDEILDVLKVNLLKAQQRMVKYANMKRRECEITSTTAILSSRHKHQKLAPRFIGPFMVVAWVGLVAYRLALLKHSIIHSVFHVFVLCKEVGANMPTFSIPKD